MTSSALPLAGTDAAHDFEAWRLAARTRLGAGLPPGAAGWGSDDLFAACPATRAGQASQGTMQVPRKFIAQARLAILHTDPDRHALLYRLLWRLQANRRLMDDAADREVGRLEHLCRAVRRDIHKMRAFLRFRETRDEAGERFVAWFEPQFPILRANAAFFVNRFTAMHWSILTPLGSLHWDGAILLEGPPGQRGDAPSADAAEDLWRKYYASIFNPARLKTDAMLKEMPRRYWKNMPEAALIPELVAGAQAREAAMIAAGAAEFGARPQTLAEVESAIGQCRRCPIGCNGTRPVMGEGPATARLMIVGEQPGDTEEAAGRPFVGPAGQLLRGHLAAVEIHVTASYVTNAVKHFKFTASAKQRLHQSPTAGEIDACRWWIESERALVRPQLVLALGASAARGLLGRTVSVQKERGRVGVLDDGSELWLTTHSSYLLRLDGEARAREEARFSDDLAAVAARMAALSET